MFETGLETTFCKVISHNQLLIVFCSACSSVSCLSASSLLFSDKEGLSKIFFKRKRTFLNVFVTILACILCTHLIFSPGHIEQRSKKRKADCSLVLAAQQQISGVKGTVPTKPDWLVQYDQTWKQSHWDVEGLEHVRTQGRGGARRRKCTAAAYHSPIPKQLNIPASLGPGSVSFGEV